MPMQMRLTVWPCWEAIINIHIHAPKNLNWFMLMVVNIFCSTLWFHPKHIIHCLYCLYYKKIWVILVKQSTSVIVIVLCCNLRKYFFTKHYTRLPDIYSLVELKHRNFINYDFIFYTELSRNAKAITWIKFKAGCSMWHFI